MISIATPTGMRLLRDSVGHGNCIKLLSHFVTQDTLTFCGPASISMVLNALGIPRPVSEPHAPHRLFTQSNLFSLPGLEVSRSQVERGGMDLGTVARVFESVGLTTEVTWAGEVEESVLRPMLVRTFEGDDRFLLSNYFRPALGQGGNGHISPICAFNYDEDCVLLLDVARYRYSPSWVGAKAMWRAMTQKDEVSNRSRGLVAASAKTSASNVLELAT